MLFYLTVYISLLLYSAVALIILGAFAKFAMDEPVTSPCWFTAAAIVVALLWPLMIPAALIPDRL